MKTVTEMAREAGIRDCTCNGTLGCLERFAELVRADEREACANEMVKIVMIPTLTHGALVNLSDVVNAIRARGSNT